MLCMLNRVVLSAKCALHYNPGPCREFSVLWHFDPIEGRCKDFLYGGCGGNENRFLTREDCKRECAAEPGRWRLCCARKGATVSKVFSYLFGSSFLIRNFNVY